ncbi:hypothetical protein BCR34DRAFT_621511 [Clohesyomyces aquaticus]|uniref:N-acetyltransferase domain-containing protein n=1 Tax=Clohesyomyces aquaticus TaxID=1231657 RepID=A0A1Y2A6K5_9PLEO|nr:hypothetical protein BCR34DRAFT_621511 [Clohesyomyces aquaticus]
MASQHTNIKVPNPSNPSSLPSRFSIRKLGPEHADWISSIVIHSNLFHSPVWPKLYPEGVTARAHGSFAAVSYLISHQINSDFSFGVFDDEYEFKNAESRATGGKLYWDASEPGVQDTEGFEAEGERLLSQMDFPLVSVAMSYDSFNPLDMEQMGPLVAQLPHFGLIYHTLATLDKRDPSSWQAQAHYEVLFRNATSTRHDYEGKGLMGGLARWLMREAEGKGYRGIQIECVSDAVTSVWSRADKGYKGEVVASFDTKTFVDEEGNKSFEPAEQVITKVYVDLKPKA